MALSSFGLDLGKSGSRQLVEPEQRPFLDFLRNSSQRLVQQQSGGLLQMFPQAEALQAQGQQFLGDLRSNPFLSSLQTQAGGNQALVDQQIGQLGTDIGQFTNEQLLPGIRRDFVGVGGLGGARNQIAEGLAAQGAQRAFSSGVTDILSADAARASQAATTGAGLTAQSALGGLQSLQGQFNLGLSPFQSQFSPLLNMNQIVGPPNVLGRSSAFNFGIQLGAGGG